jgi:arachidonate 5-lipoxygenase
MRNLPDAHPIQKLLRPHYRYTTAINTRARATLINDTGVIAKVFAIGPPKDLMIKASPVFSVNWTNIEESIERRGMQTAPGYYYRDDGLKVFKAIKDYVTKVVNLFYASDEDVKSDEEIKAWADDLFTTGFPGYFEGPQGHDFPETIVSKAELIKRCTVIIFTGSAQHASINFGQYALYGYVPNSPFTLRRPPPMKKGATNYKGLLDTLPVEFDAKMSINITYALSQHSRDEVCRSRSVWLANILLSWIS